MNSRFAIILIALVAGFGTILFISKNKADAPDGSNNAPAAQATSHTVGEGKSGVTLVEYGDFQCPACAAYHPLVKEIKEKYKEDITFQFRHFPLAQIHPNAQAAHRAAEAAGLQGKFFEMHDLLYERQNAWNNSRSPIGIFEGYAEELGLDVNKFRQDAASSAVNASINADMKAGQQAGANSTPTFVLNGQKLDQNPRDLEAFEKLITEAINEKSTGQ